MIEFTMFFEDFEAEAIQKAYEVTCKFRQELGDDIEGFDFNRFVLNAILDSGIQSGQALTDLLTERA